VRLGGAFDSTAHTVDVRNIETGRGRFNIPNIGLHLWRLTAYRHTRSPAVRVDDRRYLISPLGHPLPLFTNPQTEDEITHLAEPINDTLVVCEGELNVIAMHQMGFTNTVGPSGSTLSQRFVDIVAGKCSKVILLFDSDLGSETSAATAKIKLLTAIEQFDRLVDVFVCPDHVGDPNDMTQADVDSLIRAAQNSTLYRVEHLLDERR
jgi:hypothetical protein